MCGINGLWINSEHENFLNESILKMNHSLAHRGPDSNGSFVSENIALGHTRLSIIDLSEAANQPFYSNDKRYVIVYNGELYNYQEIKNNLKEKYQFKTSTDTEVILAAFIHHGKDCLNMFNGMYAFAVYDTVEKELFACRDRLGIKPFYYFHSEGKLVFSSEIRSVLKSGLVKKVIGEKEVAEYFRYQTVHAPNTIIKDVKMLMPGHFLEFDGKILNIKSYWNQAYSIDHSSDGKLYSEVCKDVKELFYKAVERRLVSDVPFGAFLSGGIDSSAVVGAMSSLSSQKVKTFAVTFNEKLFDESSYSQLIAKKFNTDHTEIRLGISDFLSDLPSALKSMDHPSGDGPNTYVVSKATKGAGITMALSGLGGDELFAGYDVFKRLYGLQTNSKIKYVPKPLRVLSGTVLETLKPGVRSEKISQVLKSDLSLEEVYSVSRLLFGNERMNSIFKNDLSNNDIIPYLKSCLGDKPLPILSKISIMEASSYMQNVLLRDADQMSMAHALEVRVPFLDYKLFEYVMGVKDEFKVPITPKKLLVDSLQEILPSEIINRPKMGFTFPWEVWMKNELKEFCEQNITELNSNEHVFKKDAILNLWNEFYNGNPSLTWSRVWPLIVLQNWMQTNEVSIEN